MLEGEVASTQASATVTRCGVDVTEEYPASAFAWKRDSGNAEADETWNAAHAGMKSITCTATDLNGDVKISCTLTASSATYGSITVDDDLDASHTPAELDANDVFVIEDGYLKVTTGRGNVYALEDGKVKAAGAKLNGSITAESKLFASQPEDIVEFSYDHNGLRTQKKVTKADGTVETTDYTLHGKLITHLTRGSDTMHFFYNSEKRPAMVEFNGTLYSYIHNLQGDIVGIVDSNGNLVVEYKYDAWGKPVTTQTISDSYEVLAELNPFRYRGYVYDEESELHYLKARYYCSSWYRFLSSDAAIYDSKRVGENNLYTYCSNRPVIFYDPTGKSLKSVLTDLALRLAVGLAARVFAGLSNDKEYNNYYDSDTDPTKPRKTIIEKIIEENSLPKNASVTGEYRGIIEYTALEKNAVAYVELGVWELMVTYLNHFLPGVGIAAEIGRGVKIDAVERNPGFYHCIEYTFTNEIIDYGSDGEIINSKKETWIYYEYFGVNDLTHYIEFGEYSYIENYM